MTREEFAEVAKNNPDQALLELFDMLQGLADIVAALEVPA